TAWPHKVCTYTAPSLDPTETSRTGLMFSMTEFEFVVLELVSSPGGFHPQALSEPDFQIANLDD
ncbi:MAG TPA: hypothetical protein PKN37_08650, partial [Mesotoga sp.]|nr:hypothetical protein [Mesotoga sp.]